MGNSSIMNRCFVTFIGLLVGAVCFGKTSLAQEQCAVDNWKDAEVDYKSVVWERAKAGFAEIDNPSDPPKTYLTQTIEGNGRYLHSDSGTDPVYEIYNHAKLISTHIDSVDLSFDPGSCITPPITNWWKVTTLENGIYEYYETIPSWDREVPSCSIENQIGVNSSSNVKANYSDPDCFQDYKDNGEQLFFGVYNSSSSTKWSTPTKTTHNYGYSLLTETVDCHVDTTVTLSSEFTTQMLIDLTLKSLESKPFPPGDTEEDWSNWAIASLSLSPTEDCATARKMLYRMKVPTELGKNYLLRWKLYTIFKDGSKPLEHGGEEPIEGTGSIVKVERDEMAPSKPGFTFLAYAEYQEVEGGGGCTDCDSSIAQAPGDSIVKGPLPSVALSLGKSSLGQSAGKLVLQRKLQDQQLYSPASLNYSGIIQSEVEVIRVDQAIAQVKAPQALAHINVVNTNKYEVKYYLPAAVGSKVGYLYTLTGSPYVVWTFERPSGGTNKLQITETKGASSRVFTYEWVAADSEWKFTSPGDLIQTSTRTDWNNTTKEGWSTNLVKNASGTVVSRNVQKHKLVGSLSSYNINYKYYPLLVEDRVGAAGAEQITYYLHDESRANAGRDSVVWMISPTGYWEHYEYEESGNRITRKYAQFGNATTNQVSDDPYLGRVTEYSYDSAYVTPDDTLVEPQRPRLIVEKLGGQEVSRRMYGRNSTHDYTVICTIPGQTTWDHASNLITTNYYNSGELVKTWHPDGTMQIYEQSYGASSKTKIVWSGAPNGTQTAIQEGTKSETITGAVGEMISQKVYHVAGGSVGATLSSQVYTYLSGDDFKRSPKVTYLDGTFTETSYACCGIDTFKDRDGVVTQYYYDSAKRQVASERLGITTTNILDATGNLLMSIRIGTDNSRVTNSMSGYNAARELVTQTNALSGVTTYGRGVNGSGQTFEYIINPDGGTTTNLYFKDGTLDRTTGTAAYPVRYEYGVESESGTYRLYTKEIKLTANYTDTSECTKTYADMVGRSYRTVYAAASGAPYQESSFNNRGQLISQRDPDGVVNLFAYNAKGETAYTVVDVDQDGVVDFNGMDRINWSTNDVTTAHSTTVWRQRSYVWATDNSDTALLVGMQESTFDGLRSWSTLYRDGSTPIVSQTRTVYAGSGNRYVTNTAPDSSYVISHYLNGRLNSVTQKDSTGSQIEKTTYQYDAHGRQWKVTDVRNGTTTYAYNKADLIGSFTTPTPGNGQQAQTTATEYNSSLKVRKTIYPDGTYVTNAYYPNGLLKRTVGSRVYPLEYAYDAQGRMATMKTWQSFDGSFGSGSATTAWQYDGYRGWLTNKVYDGEVDTTADYTYTPAGRVKTRVWERGITTTYKYGFDDTPSGNQHGAMTVIDYSDSTPDVTFAYDRQGRQKEVTANSITTTLTYNEANQLTKESYSGGILDTFSITNSFDSYLRRTKSEVKQSSTSKVAYNYAYDNASRLQTVDDGTYSATYGYLANSPLVSDIIFKTNSTTRMTATKQYDYLNRLASIASVPTASGQAPFSYAYKYNQANQRQRVTQHDGSFWYYEYDDLGQVISGKKFWADQTPVAGQQFEYGFDDIGNRKSTKSGGDGSGANLRSATYSPNSKNQYTSRTVPNTFDVIGIAMANESVQVNTSPADYRHGEYFREQVAVTNSSNPVWMFVAVTNIAGSTTNGNLGNVFVPKTSEVFSYDADGNLTNDGRWSYEWDGENRLKKMIANNKSPAVGPQQLLMFDYDYKGRRIYKRVWNNVAGTGDANIAKKYIYDGWNLVLEANSTNTTSRSWMWGLDLSGSEQGAGGVGGLVMYKDAQAAVGTYFPAFDGNGNVMGLVNATNGVATASYEYGPFGELTRKTGAAALANLMRFSTKYQDEETDLLYYGHRYYNASTGRWLSRDPIEENKTELNLYALVRNAPIYGVDLFGLCADFCGPDVTHTLAATMSSMEQTFQSWTKEQKKSACETITGGSLGSIVEIIEGLKAARMAWDIEELAYFQERFPNWQPFTNPGTGACKHTVSVVGKCFQAITVNYTQWGYMINLCESEFKNSFRYSLPSAITGLLLHKMSLGEYGGHMWVDQSINFTVFGYNKMSSLSISDAHLAVLKTGIGGYTADQQEAIIKSTTTWRESPGCVVKKENECQHSIFSWVWHPNNERLYSPVNPHPGPK